jgi:hypothetical protein
MNRQNLTIGAALLGAVIVVLGIVVYLDRGGSDDGSIPISGPGQAAEARGIIAEIESRREAGAAQPPARPRTTPIERPDTPAVQTVDGGAIAVTPQPAAAAPAGADTELDAAYDRALELQANGQLDDAQVLFFFGARRGHARSAFTYAELNDPKYHSPETSLLAEPDAFQAFRWYSAALDGGVEAAATRLAELHDWAEAAAASGDSKAEQLLLQWE